MPTRALEEFEDLGPQALERLKGNRSLALTLSIQGQCYLSIRLVFDSNFGRRVRPSNHAPCSDIRHVCMLRV